MITKHSRILIGGDSWGCGEWHRTYGNTHRGIEQYFRDDGYVNVKNTSVGGASNNDSVARLHNSAIQWNPDLTIWFQTDPIRDFRPYDNYMIRSYQQLCNDHIRLINSTYQKLNSIGIEIYCIGGVSKLDLETLSQFSNLKSLIPSVIEFLIPVEHPIFWCTDWAHTLDPNLDMASTELLYELLMNPPLRLEQDYPEYFKPDNYHPNRHGHRKIYEYIHKKFTGEI